MSLFRHSLTGWSKNQLRNTLLVFFLALSIPTAILIYQAYSQLKWEAFHRHQLLAEELTNRVDQRLLELMDIEESRLFTDYSFLNVVGDPAANFLQRSSLSEFPVNVETPGVLGHFQVDAEGSLTTPLLPVNEQQSLEYGISASEFTQRRALQNQLQSILTQNSLVQRQVPGKAVAASPVTLNEADALAGDSDSRRSGDSSLGASSPSLVEEGEYYSKDAIAKPKPQSAFDDLTVQTARKLQKSDKKNATRTYQRIEDLKLESRFENINQLEVPAPSEIVAKEKRKKRIEKNALPEKTMREQKAEELAHDSEMDFVSKEILQVKLFESEIDPFNISLLDSGHFVLFRKVWRDDQRYIQGLLIEPDKLIEDVIEDTFRRTNLSYMSNLAVAYQGNILALIKGRLNSRSYTSNDEALYGSLLYQKQLSAPLSDIELIFSINRLPVGPASTVINWVAIILGLVLCGGFLFMYRMGLTQINLVSQQQDFVSAVSHELKTPLTSIRMYGEMLREGWADEDKKKTYYNYIHDESERLTRLINNVLQLARMTRNELPVELKPVSINELLDMIRSKVSSSVEQAGYHLNIICSEEVKQVVIQVDTDYFNQIIINLVDNAIKFSSKSRIYEVDINCQVQQSDTVVFSVRDYGPGIGKDQMRKIFKLFYRSENELTRETLGTGIGLALVQQLAQAMNAKVDVVNCDVGAEFRIIF